MESLIHLIKSLKGREVRLIKCLYKESAAEPESKNKRLKLFNLILEGKICLNKDASVLLGPEKHNSTLCHLKKRLEQDIQDVILVSPLSELAGDNTVKAELKCYKYLLLAKVIIQRGLIPEGLALLEKASRLAGKFELPYIKLACDDFLGTVRSPSLNETQSHRFNQEINHSIKSIRNISGAKAINSPFLHVRSSAETASLKALNLHELEDKTKKSKCRKAVHWYTLAIIHYYIQQKDLAQAQTATNNLVKTLKANPTVLSGHTHEGVEFYNQLAKILIYLKYPEIAIWAAETAVGNFQENRPELLPACETLFLAYFRVDNLNKAAEIMDRVEKQQAGKVEGMSGIWYLFKASLKTAQKKFIESNKWLHTKEKLFHESFNFKLYARLLELMNILELKDYEWFEYKLDSFHKRLLIPEAKRWERMQIMYKLLNCLRKSNYNYQETQLMERDSLALLQSNLPGTGWDPLGFEIIEFHQWFARQAEDLDKFRSNKDFYNHSKV